MLVLESIIITGNDRGEISIIDKTNFKILTKTIVIDSPILKITQ